MKECIVWAAAFALLGMGRPTLADPPQPVPPQAPPPQTPPQNAAVGGNAPAATTTETIVLIRHGEKTATELGQLSNQGINRALAIPDVLIGKYGKPDYLFAPNPSAQIGAGGGVAYSYVRPLATIEPTAIRLGMPVNTQIGFGDIKGLQDELAKPNYAGAVVFIAWEHGMEDEFAKNVMKTYAKDDSMVPHWPGKDYDSIFVIRLVHSGTATTATFTHDQEGLDGKLSKKPPAPASP